MEKASTDGKVSRMKTDDRVKEEKVEPSGCDCQQTPSVQSDGRRRLIRGGLSAGPVLLALSGKSAMAAGVCRFPSTWASLDPAAGGNPAGLSHHAPSDADCGMGRSPGFWKQAQKRIWWPAPYVKPDSLPCGVSATGAGPGVCNAYRNDGTEIGTVFAGTGTRTFQKVLCNDSGSDLWHFTAAYLNAWTVQNYPLTKRQVVDMWNGTFRVQNSGVPWTRARSLQFIQLSYDHGNLDGSDPQFKVAPQVVPCWTPP